MKDEEPNTYQEPFYKMLQASEQPLYDGWITYNEFSTAVKYQI